AAAHAALHHQHQVSGNSLLPLLNAGTEPPDQKPVLPILLDQKPPVTTLVAVVKKEPKSKTPFICGYCGKAFRDSYHLRRHESCHTGIKMVSRPKKIQMAPTMVPLISTVTRENNGNPTYVTTVAGILTTATTSMGSGVMSAAQQQTAPKKPPKPVKKNHGCDMCGKAFRDVYHLNRHKLSHSDEKPFECPICHQRFKRKDRMTYHVRSHDGGVHKPYICSVCGKGFSRPDHLSCHVKHVHSSERPFKCQACTSAFATKDRLRSHMIRHEGKVTCTICGKMLSAAYITSHLKTHGQASFNNPCNNKEHGVKKQTCRIEMNKTAKQAVHFSWFGGALHSLESVLQICLFLFRSSNTDAGNVQSSSVATTPATESAATTSAGNRNVNTSNAVTITTQMNIATNTVNITSPVNLQHPVSITGPVNLASIPTTAHMNIAHPVAISTAMPMNITGPLNIAMRSMESMPFLSQVLPSSPPW
uniref:C2H2-type domain-containing protein n=1 Tax=Oryzias latipes TaxID=8090 RepID=A0A3P9HYW4_ORYLA